MQPGGSIASCMPKERQLPTATLARRPRHLPLLVLAAVLALVSSVLQAAVGAPARADTAPPVAGTPPTVSADVLPTVQVNGVVWAHIIVGDRVYATGQFSSARPAGSPAGTNETPRSNILAFDLNTGALISSWAPTLDAAGLSIAASADGSRIFVGGGFNTVSGLNRYHLVALDATTGTVIPSFSPGFNATVRALAVRGNTLYAGGIFTVAASQARDRLAAVDATTGELLPWAPTADAEVMAMTAPAGGSSVVVGGRFTLLNGAANYGLGALDGTSGAVLPFPTNQVVRNAGDNAAIYSLTSGGGKVYGSGYTFGSGGNMENTFAADAATGALLWASGCRGDTYSTAVVEDVLYSVGHPHDCSTLAGFPQTNPWTYQRAMAQFYDGRVNTGGNFSGRPAPSLLHWLPTLNVGTYTGQSQAAWSVAANGSYVVLGGEFPSINGVAQAGLARFAVKTIAPNLQGPQGGTSMAPTVTGVAPGTVRFSFLAGWDRDNVRLKYEVLRGPKLSSTVVVATGYRESTWWSRPSMAVVDTGAVPGTTESYRVRMTDPFGNVAYSATVTGTVPAGTPPTMAYRDRVVADGAVNHWRLGEASGTASYDWSGQADLTLSTATTRNVAGVVVGDPNRAATFTGTDSVPAVTAGGGLWGPQTFSVEAWFKTTTRVGGKIIGYGNKNNAASTSYDRQVYMNNAGQLVFGVSSGSVRTVTSPAAYNNGQWHQVVGTLGADGLRLYVDGALVASRTDTTSGAVYIGWWRIAGDTLNGWPTKPTSASFGGTLDEVAVYPGVLAASTVLEHYQAATGTLPNQPPTAAFGSTVANLTAAFDGTASSDADGAIAAYAWDFGDGATGTGATTTHTYAAAGTYQVTLTVTDDDGATAAVTHAVTVTEPPPANLAASDAFGRTVASGFGTADIGGAWTVNASGVTVSVADGSGRLSIPAGRTATALLPSVSVQDTDLVSTVWVETQPTGGGVYSSSVVRSTSAGDYRARLKIQPNGQCLLNLSRTAAGAETALTTQVLVPGVTYTPGMKLSVRVQATGSGTTTLRARVWATGTTEPTTWLQSVTDTTAGLQVAGAVGLVDYVSGTATEAPVVRHDDLTATLL
jgi:PKD repeat protein